MSSAGVALNKRCVGRYAWKLALDEKARSWLKRTGLAVLATVSCHCQPRLVLLAHLGEQTSLRLNSAAWLAEFDITRLKRIRCINRVWPA
jgi:hypothetical protein